MRINALIFSSFVFFCIFNSYAAPSNDQWELASLDAMLKHFNTAKFRLEILPTDFDNADLTNIEDGLLEFRDSHDLLKDFLSPVFSKMSIPMGILTMTGTLVFAYMAFLDWGNALTIGQRFAFGSASLFSAVLFLPALQLERTMTLIKVLSKRSKQKSLLSLQGELEKVGRPDLSMRKQLKILRQSDRAWLKSRILGNQNRIKFFEVYLDSYIKFFQMLKENPELRAQVKSFFFIYRCEGSFLGRY